jgi:SAM-dependent methyltransferase
MKVVEQGRPGKLPEVCWRQWRTERALAARGVRFRSTDPARVAAAYAAMSPAEFEAVNGRQAWANWRTVPAALRGRLPARPVRAFDLGCGTGTSTRVLARVLPAGSEIVGYEPARPLADRAGQEDYRPARVRFVCQPVDEPWRRPDGTRVPDGSADLVHASGLVGHHFDPETVRPLLAEVGRVLAPGGLALLDDGPTLPRPALVTAAGRVGLRPVARVRSWWLAPAGQVLFRKGPA